MISQHTFESLILTNTIVAAFCIVLMVTLTGFLVFLLIPSIRRRWFGRDIDAKPAQEIQAINPQHQFSLGPSRLNPVFESTTGATTTTTQFGTLFHPHATTATLLHPTIWTPLQQTPVMTTSVPSQPPPPSASAPAPAPPPIPSNPPVTTHRQPRKR